jgi:heptosyltransferase-1
MFKPSAIGDVVHALPILNLLKRRWPEARVSWLATPACAPIVRGNPQVEEVIEFNRPRYGHAWRSPTASLAMWRFIRGLRERRFDLVIDLQGLFRSGWMSWATGAPMRVGFDDAREGAPWFYTHAVSSGGWWHQHAIGRYLHLAKALGCDIEPVEFHFAVSEANRARARELVPDGTAFAALVPGTHWPTKRWPAEKFAELVNPLREEFGLQSIVLGGPDEKELGEKIIGARNLIGATKLPETIALLERAALVITNDSGPMHIASALGRPLVALFGPTSPLLTGPYGRMDSVVRLGLPCSPCYSRKCSHQSCLQWLGADLVLEKARQQLMARAV